MATVTITIDDPVLSGSEVFHVKYKLTSDISWTSISDKTNAPFDITGLSDGDYELSITISDKPDCAEVIECFTVSTKCACPTFSNASITTTNQINYVSFDIVTTNGGSPLTEDWPPCGITIVLTDDSGAIQKFTVNNPSSFTRTSANHYTWKQQVQGTHYIVQIYTNCCAENGNGNKLCNSFDVALAQSPATCIPFRIADVAAPHAFPDNFGNYYLLITIYNSVPACDTFDIGYEEIYTWTSPPDTGSYHLTGALALPVTVGGTINLKIPVHPNADDFGGYSYRGSITDCCGNTLNF